jgi:hypothetical protein
MAGRIQALEVSALRRPWSLWRMVLAVGLSLAVCIPAAALAEGPFPAVSLTLSRAQAIAPGPGAPPVPADGLPDGFAVATPDGALSAWLIQPTGRYKHAVLGDAIEAGGIALADASGSIARLTLPDDLVLEDIAPRPVALAPGGDAWAMLTVLAHRDHGAAPVLYGLRDGAVVEIARGPFIGRANRWLNPIGAADLDGDGRVEIAVIETPHIAGTLVIYRQDGSALTEVSRLPGYSTHAIGSRALGLGRIVDLPDGGAGILMPDRLRTSMALVILRAGTELVERARVTLPASVSGDLQPAPGGAGWIIPLQDGSVWQLTIGG